MALSRARGAKMETVRFRGIKVRLDELNPKEQRLFKD